MSLLQIREQQPMNSLSQMSSELIEKITLQNDLAGMSSLQKVQYVKGICNTMGLNPLTKPIQLIKFQGREIPYVTKDGGEQLRKLNKISITKIDTKILDGGVYVATACASAPDGRTDSSTGVISISGLKGDALANAMMKAETKSKRRVTLSICGLGFLDESEIDTMQGAQRIDIESQQISVNHVQDVPIIEHKEEVDIDDILLDISQCNSLEELENTYKVAYKKLTANKDKESLKKLIDAKNDKKEKLNNIEELKKEIDFDSETGEIK